MPASAEDSHPNEAPIGGDRSAALSRRALLKKAATWTALGALGCWPFLEAKWCRVRPVTVSFPRLPRAFDGLRVAFLSDIHHGPFVPLAYVRRVVEMTNFLEPDLICLGGDYVHHSAEYIAPSLRCLGKLRARLGVHAVLGNHDHWEGATETRGALAQAGFADQTNRGEWIRRGTDRLRIGGVGDLWEDRQDLVAALEDTREEEAALLLSHNPDYIDSIHDRRVGLVLSGHTHGGQVAIPGLGAPVVPSQHGQKYVSGLVSGPKVQGFVTCGVGTIGPPVRLGCRPEIALITLAGQ